MTISVISSSTVKVLMTQEDMQSYNIEFDNLDKSNTPTRLFLTRLIGEIRHTNDIDLSHEKLYIEAFPQSGGGCLIYISIGGEKFKQRTRVCEELVYEFFELYDLIGACTRLWNEHSHLCRSSELYCSDKSYRLILKAFSKSEDKLCRTINEYGSFLGASEISAAATREHFSPVIEKNAVEVLASIS